MIIVKPAGAPRCCPSERVFLRAIHDHPGVFIANVNVPNSTDPGAFSREVDGVMLTPTGVYTVEVKGVRAAGELATPRMDSWSVGEGEQRTVLHGRPHGQALGHSKFLSSFLKDTGIRCGWIRAVLAFAGDDLRLPDGSQHHLIDNVHVVLARPGVMRVLTAEEDPATTTRDVTVETVQQILEAFECREDAPTVEDLCTEGFLTEADLSREIEQRRQQARQEFLSLPHPAAEHAPSGVVDVAEGPSVSDWAAGQTRFDATRNLDPDLCETGAVVDGVPLHRRLVTHAQYRSLDLSEIAALVNRPVEVLGDPEDNQRAYCGHEHAVVVRTVDGMAMSYRPVAVVRAERDGAQVDGVTITARAARQASGGFDVPLAAVARTVLSPEERWWIGQGTEVANARGDLVAVTDGPGGPVTHLQTRASAVARAVADPPTTPAQSGVTAMVHDGVTVGVGVQEWCLTREVPVAALCAALSDPVEVWPGWQGKEIRVGSEVAVLVDTVTASASGGLTATEVAEVREGVVVQGVSISPVGLHLARKRKVVVAEVAEAVLAPVLVAREPGSGATVYVGDRVAVTVADATGQVVDFTYARHARSLVRRGVLVEVTPGASPSAPVRAAACGAGRPSPLLMARLPGR